MTVLSINQQLRNEKYQQLKLVDSLWNTTMTLMLTMAISSVSVLINVGVVSQNSSESLYILGLFLPLNYIMMAIHEGLRIPILKYGSQHEIYSAKEIGQRLLILYFILFLLMSALILLIWAFQGMAVEFFHVIPAQQYLAKNFILLMLTVGIIIGFASLTMSCLFGLGLNRWASFLGISGTLLNISVTCCAANFWEQGLYSLVWGAVTGSVYLFLSSLLLLLSKNIRFSLHGIHNVFRTVMMDVVRMGIPVMGSFLLLFAFLSCFNFLVSFYGASDLAGFGIAFRIQSFIIIPAIALGTAMAIHANKAVSLQHFLRARQIFFIGLGMSALIYLVISLIFYFFQHRFIELFTSNAVIIDAAGNYFNHVSASYLSLGVVLTLMTALEQTGQGLKIFFINITFYSLEVGFAALLGLNQVDTTRIYLVISIMNWLSSLYLCFEIGKRLLAKPVPHISGGTLRHQS
ncbi:multidrug efflux protein [Vibrio ruber DSM 16370]|uniref:Multidrug efflux protein n=1 Tax=Vibrio ruber (strain DSM 16370 / JCM 11486 / BCRC 17186 / CECT 7878 / LMG 23124 / VR1) TaxID=1123498 RepID=A0A1R4LDJ7_VIBR1|nr:MATE family efflux transporter [Vibrio ruber]SJN54646.1 multidrug efflux protein [Vibrio ruber DSM 16370]